MWIRILDWIINEGKPRRVLFEVDDKVFEGLVTKGAMKAISWNNSGGLPETPLWVGYLSDDLGNQDYCLCVEDDRKMFEQMGETKLYPNKIFPNDAPEVK